MEPRRLVLGRRKPLTTRLVFTNNDTTILDPMVGELVAI